MKSNIAMTLDSADTGAVFVVLPKRTRTKKAKGRERRGEGEEESLKS